jgi:amidohydrolase
MPTKHEFKNRVQKEVDAFKDKLIAISDAIHKQPELGLREYRACELLIAEIESFGFRVDHPVADLDTAFLASFKGQKEGRKIALLAEYDALPGLGHACGHNIIAAAALGAALALKKVVSQLGGAILLYGTPDEEAVDARSRGGKVLMTKAGLFDGLDAALMMHPTGGASTAWAYSFPLKDFSVRFLGKPAHYTVPHRGINALESLLMFLNNVNTLKREWMPNVMFAYTITDGGGPSAIVVPASAEAHITMKAFYSEYLENLFESVRICAHNVAATTGAKVEIKVLGEYKNMVPNLHLVHSLGANMRTLGMEVEDPCISQRRLERLSYPGVSTDFGDVSWIVPGIHAYCSIGGNDLVHHTPEFAAAAGSEKGHTAVTLSAKAMAMTAVDILADNAFADNMKAEFDSYQSEKFIKVPGLPPDYLPFPEEFTT